MSEKQQKKFYIRKKRPLSLNTIDKLKEDINKIDPNKIIIESLNSARNYLSDKNLKKNKHLEQIKKNVINTFLSDIKNKEKNIELVKNTYTKQLKVFTNSSNLLVEKAKKQTREFISKFKVMEKENKILEQTISDIKNKYKDMKIQKNNTLNQINQMRMRINVLTKNKTLFNEFLKQFNYQTPKKIIQDIEKNENGFNNVARKYNNAINKIILEKKLFKIQYQKQHSEISNANNKILNLEDESVLMQKEYDEKVNQLQSEIMDLQGLKEDNDKYRKMLYQLYNRLIDTYGLDKNIRINKKYLYLNKEDYNPNLLDDNEVCKYIKLMISSMNPSTSDQLLREITAYSKMITRIYLKNKINLKYDSLTTFKELKDLMDQKEEKISELSNDLKAYQDKINSLNNENKKLNNLINNFLQEKNKSIQNKRNLTSNLRPSTSQEPIKFGEKNYKKISNKKYFKNIKKKYETTSILKKKHKNINSLLINDEIKTTIRSPNPNHTFRFKQDNNKNIEQSKITTSSSQILSRKIKKNKSRNNINLIYDEDNYYLFSSIDSKTLKNPLFQSLQSMKSNQLINRYFKNYNNSSIKEGKNIRTKLYNKQPMMSYTYEFKQLLNHLNRIFLYQARMSPNLGEKKIKDFKNNGRINKFNSLIKKIKKNQSTGNLLQDIIKAKIVTKINGIINNLEYKEKNKEKDND